MTILTRSMLAALAAAAIVGMLIACTHVRGGEVARTGNAAKGDLIAEYTRGSCTSSAPGGPAPSPPGKVTLLHDAQGTPFVVVEREHPDLPIAIHNSFADKDQIVFQALIRTGNEPETLWEYRFPAKGVGPGREVTTRDFQAAPQSDPRSLDTFAMIVGTPLRTCSLGSGDAPPWQSPTLVRTAAPRPVVYSANDGVIVDTGDGGTAAAKIVAVFGRTYVVQYDSGASEWLGTEQIKGR